MTPLDWFFTAVAVVILAIAVLVTRDFTRGD
jgi:bacteriorhodopsin